jgi:predicted dehydrogenase
MNQPLSRRNVLKGSAAVAAAASLSGFTAKSYGNIVGSNDAIRMAVIGFNSRGNSHIDAFGKMKGVRLVALCDADEAVLARGVKRVEGLGKPKAKPTTKPAGPATKPIARTTARAEMVGPEDATQPATKPATKLHTFTDLRRVFDSKEIDAVSTATPNHWHSLIVVWACQAGKDVYVEKPVSHNVWEGSQAVAAARKYNRIVQAGTQSRSNMALKAAYEWVQGGGLGKILVSRGLCYKRRASIGQIEAGKNPVPKSVDFDLWTGPAAKEDIHRKQFHYDWHWQWNCGNGDLGNQGIHQMDTARWALGKNTLAPRVLSIGGRFGYKDDGETPNTQFVVQDYGDSLLIFEVRGLPKESGSELMDKYKGMSVGTVVECEGGYMTDSGYTSSPVAYDKDGKQVRKFTLKDVEGGEDNGGHFENFIKAVRSRDVKDLHADIQEGHLSSALCHTGNLSYRLGKPVQASEIEGAVKDNKGAGETWGRFKEHLANNEVELKGDTQAVLGAYLEMDPKTERFTNNDKANEMLTRQYRAPFIVPTAV